MAGNIVRRFTKGIFVWINIFFTILFLLSCLAPYLNPTTWWFMGFFGILFPYLALILLIFIIFWWVVKPSLSLISIITLLIGFKQFSVLWGFKTNTSFVAKKGENHLRIIDWNIRSFEGLSNKNDKKRIDRLSIAEAIITRNPDIICLQEFNHSKLQDNLALFTKKYPYYYYARDFQSKANGYMVGCVIFSKYPIKDSAKVKFSGSYSESLISADIETPSGVLRVYNTHLQSFKFEKEDYDKMDKIKKTEDVALRSSRPLVSKMKRAFTIRGQQAELVRGALDQSTHPSLIAGDFNDVPNSYTYFHIKKDWQDAFLQNSFGIGRTYLAVAPTLRIDYVLANNQCNVHQFEMVDEDLSDHLMLIADVSIK